MADIVKWKQIGKTGIAVGLIILVLGWLLGWILALIVVPIAIIALLLFAYFYLAPRNIFFTMIKDGTSIVVDKGGEIDHLLMSWGGYIFKVVKDGKQSKKEDNWIIVEGEDWHIFGGLRWIGIWPLYAVRNIEAEWDHYHTDKKELVHHSEKQTAIWLKKDNYGTRLTEKRPAEDIDGVAVSATMLFPSKVYNPFIIASRQKYWFSLVEPIMAAVLKQFIARYRWKEDLSTMIAGKGIQEAHEQKGLSRLMIEGHDLREELWTMIKDEVTRIIPEDTVVAISSEGGEELRLYGVAILQVGTTIIDVDPGTEYRKAGTLKYIAEKEKEAKIIAAQATAEAAILEAKARAAQVGARYVGINEELKKDDSMGKEDRSKLAADFTMRDLAGQNGEHKIIDIRGVDVSNGLVGAAAVFSQVSQKGQYPQPKEKTVAMEEKKERAKKLKIYEGKPGTDGVRATYNEATKTLAYVDKNGVTVKEVTVNPKKMPKENEEDEKSE